MTERKKFSLISGHLSIDLVNTELISHGQRHDLLMSEQDVIDLIERVNEETFTTNHLLIEKIKNKRIDVLASIREFRSILRKNFESIADTHCIPDSFIHYLEQNIKKAPFSYKLMKTHLFPDPIGREDDALISHLSFDVLTLIANEKLYLLKKCANKECVLLFLDETGRRKWCSMKICGNRNKVTKYPHNKSVNQ